MPNHWRTKLVFSRVLKPGEKETIERACVADGGLCAWVFPMPDWLRNTQSGGATIRRWGTKWGTYNHEFLGPRTLAFYSEWGPPNYGCMQAICDRIGVSFRMYGHDEEYRVFHFHGVFNPQKGKAKCLVHKVVC